VFDQNDLLLLAQTSMPFGKYQGWLLIDLPEPYLLWFADNGFPEGRLGRLLGLALEIKINGLEHLLKPLKPPQQPRKSGKPDLHLVEK
jgi:uncharacterized protein (DUF3820 family)